MDDEAGQAAIVGMAVLLPGADSLDAYWDNLASGYDQVSVAAALAFVRGLRARLLDRLIDLAFGWHARRRDRALRSGLAAGAVR
jgi:Beta-ketoacyl synthase, N-terminal domain